MNWRIGQAKNSTVVYRDMRTKYMRSRFCSAALFSFRARYAITAGKRTPIKIEKVCAMSERTAMANLKKPRRPPPFFEAPRGASKKGGGLLGFFKFAMAVRSLIAQTFSIFIGVLFPAVMAYRALKENNAAEQKRLLMYFVLMSLYTTVEFFAWPILQFMPFYYEFKCVIIIFLLHPDLDYASKLYAKLEKTGGKHIDKGLEASGKVYADVEKKAKEGLEVVQKEADKMAAMDGDKPQAKAAKMFKEAQKKATEAAKKAQEQADQALK
mmetsp:Transcript_26765/g.67132  ORF Transcript_26765/g.67132 Transcript_26765/m.67132 type:complete len:268 (-) Transcript_26765:119-922(-)